MTKCRAKLTCPGAWTSTVASKVIPDPRAVRESLVMHETEQFDRDERVMVLERQWNQQLSPRLCGCRTWGATAMKVFQVVQAATGAVLWTGIAANPLAALKAMARDAGYHDPGDLPGHLRDGGLHVEEVHKSLT